MADWKDRLKEELKDAGKIAVMGIGSCLRADDAAGAAVAENLIRKFTEEPSPGLRIYGCGTAPENFTGAIRGFSPDYIIVVDAADFQAEPGSVTLLSPLSIGGASFSTHMLPLAITLEYLVKETGCAVEIIGIQPVDLSFGSPMTGPVKKAVVSVTNALVRLLFKKEIPGK
jgi:hydrogenase 3 maturation protease